MNEIILKEINGEALVSSRDVAESFRKERSELREIGIALRNEKTEIMKNFLSKFFEHENINTYYKIFEIYTFKTVSCVYIVKDKSTGLSKIGKTINFSRRYRELCSFCANHLGSELMNDRLILCSPSEVSRIEKDLHDYYAIYREHGEWFNLKDNQYDDNYFGEGQEVVLKGENVHIDMCMEVLCNYKLREDLEHSIQSSIFTSSVFNKTIPCWDEEPWKAAKVNKMFEYMRDNECGFSTPFDKRLGLNSIIKIHADPRIITLEEAYDKQIKELLK